MPLDPVEITFETSSEVPEAKKKIVQTVMARKGRMKVDYPTELVAGFGSGAKTRLLGGAWIDKSNFPRDLLVSLRQTATGTSVRLVVRDTLGFGSRAGMSEKYLRVMNEDAIVVKSTFQDAR